MTLIRTLLIPIVFIVSALSLFAAEPVYHAELVFDPAVESHGHVHASAIVICPDGALRTVWYENGPDLPTERSLRRGIHTAPTSLSSSYNRAPWLCGERRCRVSFRGTSGRYCGATRS